MKRLLVLTLMLTACDGKPDRPVDICIAAVSGIRPESTRIRYRDDCISKVADAMQSTGYKTAIPYMELPR